MKNDLQKKITELLEKNKNYSEMCLDNIKVLTHGNKKHCSYIEGRLYQATQNIENFKEMCLHDISLEAYVAMIESTLKTYECMLKTMVKPVFVKDTSNYNYFEGKDHEMRDTLNLFEGKVHEMRDTLNLLQEIMKREKNNKVDQD